MARRVRTDAHRQRIQPDLSEERLSSVRRVAPTHCAGSLGPRRTCDLGSGPPHPVDLNAADRAASVGGREAAHGHVASLRPYRLSAGSRCAEQPKPARQRDPARMVRAKILAPHRGARRARASPGRRRSAWRALAIDRHALAFGPGHGAGGLDHVGDVVWPFGVGESVRARWAPSMRRVRDSAVVMVAWVVMALPGRPKRNRERSNGSIALPPAYRGGTLLPGRPGVVQGILLGWSRQYLADPRLSFSRRQGTVLASPFSHTRRPPRHNPVHEEVRWARSNS